MIQTRKLGEWLEITVPTDWRDLSIDDIFRQKWAAPKKLIHQFRMDKKVMVNKLNVNWNEGLKPGDRIAIKLFEPQEFCVIPSYYDIEVLFEDDHLLVVNKPAGIDTHPNSPEQTNTLLNAVSFYLQVKGEQRTVRHVHRLDRDTTGAILFAKHSLSGAILDQALEQRKLKRTYFALCDGIIKQKKGIIDKPIGRDRHHPTRRRVSDTGQKAVTHFKLIDVFHKQNMSLVQCQLDTGRTHQIRVHLSSIGYPLCGDSLYGGSSVFKRQALHAVKIEFIHPITSEMILCTAPFLDEPQIFPRIDPFSI